MIRYRLGTMGYSYTDWQGPFYPNGVAQSRWLNYYAKRYDTVELNTTFYAAPTEERARNWASKVAENFHFTLKTPRSITHDNPLNIARAPMAEFVGAARAFGSCLGPILLQLGPHVTADAFGDLDRLLASLPTDLRFAVEFRHSSWVDHRTTDLLCNHNAAWVGLDHLDHPHLRRLRGTANFIYVRLVGRHGRFAKTDREQVDVMRDLQQWQTAIEREIDRGQGTVKEVWVISGNDFAGYAPGTLQRFASIAGIDLPTAPGQTEMFVQ